MLDGEWKTAVRRRLRICVEECRMCKCGILKDENGDHTVACQKRHWRTRIHDRVRDSVAGQLRRKGAAADTESVAPQRSKQFKDKQSERQVQIGEDRCCGHNSRDELQCLDITIRRPTAATSVEVANWAEDQGRRR